MPFLYRINLSFPGSGIILAALMLLLLAVIAISWTVVYTVAMLGLCAYLIPTLAYERFKNWRAAK
jgi:hypothetical protein